MIDESGDRPGGHGFLDAVRRHRARFESAVRRAEEERTLPGDIVDLMCDLRLFWLKTPAELGGSELDPLRFCDVLEEIAYYDASAAWSAMVGNGTTGTVAGWLPDEGVGEVFPSTEGDLPICAGQFHPRGTALPVAGGYRVTGRWSFASGINHAQWVVGGCEVADEGTQILVVVPKTETTLHDTWHVAGLQGTGSGDFSLDSRFVPGGRAINLGTPALRGGDLFKPSPLLFVSNELSPVAVGIARRAIDDMYELASGTARRAGGIALSDRAAFQKDIGRAESQLRAVQLLYRDTVRQTWAGTDSSEAFVAGLRAQHNLVVEVCMDLVSRIFRYGGGRVLALDHPMQRHLRNLTAAMQHVYLSDENYELAGKAKLASLAAQRSAGSP